MIVRIIEDDKHDNFYEGNRVGFHEDSGEFLTVIVENNKDSLTIEVEKNKNIRIFIMNNEGKTINKINI